MPVSGDFDSSLTSESITRRYYVSDAPREADAYVAVLQHSPLNFGTLYRSTMRGQSQGVNLWYVDVTYESGTTATDALSTEDPGTPPSPGESTPLDGSFSLDTTGATKHITQALQTHYRRTRADGLNPGVGTGPNEELAIGLTDDAVEGTDIFSPSLQITRSLKVPFLTIGFVRDVLYHLTGRTNDRPFLTFAEGEVLYLGCSGSFTPRERWNLTHKFAISPNQIDVEVGNGIGIPFLRGWQYVWCAYEKKQVGNLMLPVPTVAYVQDVYRDGNFDLLGVG